MWGAVRRGGGTARGENLKRKTALSVSSHQISKPQSVVQGQGVGAGGLVNWATADCLFQGDSWVQRCLHFSYGKKRIKCHFCWLCQFAEVCQVYHKLSWLPPRMVYLPPFLSDLLYLSILMSMSPDWLWEPRFPTRKALLRMGKGALVVFIIKGCS